MEKVDGMAHIDNVESDEAPESNISSLPVDGVDLGLGLQAKPQSPKSDLECGSGDHQAHPTNQTSFRNRLKHAFTLPFQKNGRFSPAQLPRIKKRRFRIGPRNKQVRHDQLNEELSPRPHVGPTTVRQISEEDIQSLDLDDVDVDDCDNALVTDTKAEEDDSFRENVDNFRIRERTRTPFSSWGRMVANPFTSCFGKRRSNGKEEQKQRLEMSVMNKNCVLNEVNLPVLQ